LLGFLAVSDGIDAEVAYALGLLHLLRGESRGDAGQQDLLVALILLLPIYLTQPDALPDPVRSWIGGLDGVAALAAVPLEQALAVALVEVGNLLLQRLVRLGEFGNGAAVVGVVRRAVGGLPEGHEARALALCNLGYALLVADPRSAEVEGGARASVVDETVAVFREAFGQTPPTDPNYARCAYGLAVALRVKADLAQDHSLLVEAVGLFRATINSDTSDDKELARQAEVQLAELKARPRPLVQQAEVCLAEVEVWLADPRLDSEERAKLEEARAALNDGLATLERALGRTPRDVFAEWSPQSGASKTGDAGSVEDPMSFLAKLFGVGSTNVQHPNTRLADFLATHLGYFKNLEYLMEFGFKAVNDIAREQLMGQSDRAGSDERPPWSSRAALAKSGRNPRADRTDLDEILGLHERLLRELPTDTPEYLQLRILYGALSRARMRDRHDAGAMAQLEEEIGQQWPSIVQALSARLRERFSTREEVENSAAMSTGILSPFETMGAVDDTIRRYRRQLAAMPEDHPDRRATLTHLAHALFTRYMITSEEVIFQEAVGVVRQTLTATSLPDPQLVYWWGLAAYLRPASDEMTEASAPASESRSSGIAVPSSGLALVKIFDGDAPGALVALENGRAIMLSSAFITRREVDDLRAVEPRLAERFVMLRERSYPDLNLGREAGALQRERALIEEWNTVLDQIKTLPGFDRFLLPAALDYADLVPAAAEGPVITINIDRWRCDALVLHDGEAQVVSLPRLHAAELVEQATAFQAAIGKLSTHPRNSGALVIGAASRVVLDTLGWLWDVLAEPVFDALRFGEHLETDQPWPRMWWSPTGPLNFLPLHAAGHHETAGASVLDRVVSSYTPTLRALLHSRSRRTLPRPHTALAVAMPETPDHAALPETVREITAFAAGLTGPAPLIGPAATRAAVLDALPGATLAHFACHASSDPTDPSTSHLLLHDGPLNVTEISRIPLDGAELAYLSSCATARGSTVLADEAIHLASAFQLAGYAQAIGTLWEVSDDVAARTATNFHRELTQTINDSARKAGALALHTVTRRMRKEMPTNPWAWAAYVHAGA
jgi:tetratricopeptide (TPR) repeat protein